jgi:hypothetical protein
LPQTGILVSGMCGSRVHDHVGSRVLTAMATQTREQGRYLGGRPPLRFNVSEGPVEPIARRLVVRGAFGVD